MSKNVLITGIGGDIGQSVIHCLKETDYDFFLVGCDSDQYAASKKTVDKFYNLVPVSKEEEYLKAIVKIIEENSIKYIFPLTEVEIELYDRQRNFFKQKGVDIFIHDSDIISTFLDKLQTVNFLNRHNILCPKTYLLAEYKEGLSYPFLLKPRRGCGARGNFLIEDGQDLSYYKKKIKDGVVQEIVSNVDSEYTAAVFSDRKNIYSIAFRRYLGYEGLSKVAHFVDDQDITDLVTKIAEAVNLSGSLNIQMRKDKRGYIPFEINPRFSSTVYLRHYFGFQDVKWWIDLKEKLPIIYKRRYQAGVAVRTIGEVFFDLI